MLTEQQREVRDEMARVILLSAATRMKPETAVHYANNLVAAGFGRADTGSGE